MFQPDGFHLGLSLVLAGLACWLLIRLLFWRVSQPYLSSGPADSSSVEPLQDHGDAVLLLSTGRITQLNQKARALFHLQDEEQPNLERLARLIRPSETFLQLCANAQQARLVLDGRLVECLSYRLASDGGPLMMVLLRDPAENGDGRQPGYNGGTLQTFVELNQAMAASLDLATTIQTILENIQKMVPADWMEITVWDAGLEQLIPYRLTGGEGEKKVEISAFHYQLDQGTTGKIARQRQPLLIDDLQSFPDPEGEHDPSRKLLHAYLGVPLFVGKELIGTLELASQTPGSFRAADLDFIRMLSGQAAIAVHNALLYEAEQKRLNELSGLAQLSQAFGSARDPRTLFTQLVESILPLVNVQILGFLLYNEGQRMLEGQAPFHGLPEQFLEMYRIPVPTGSPLEQAMVGQDVLMSDNAAEDGHWEGLGLGPMARGASLRETVLVPLASGGRLLGYLQASNHNPHGQPFTQEELHLLVIVANQAAPVIDNFTLIQQSRQRAQRAESLRRIASLASSAANLDEILKFSLQELARLLQADVAAVFLMQPNSGELQFQWDSMFGRLEPLPGRLSSLRRDDPQFHFTVTGAQRALVSGSLSEEPAVVPFYQAIQVFWGLQAVVIVPLVIRDEGIGELWLGSQEIHFFDKGSLQVAATAAGQLAGVVEQSYLFAQTDETLRRRVEQLTALTRISRQLSTSQDLQHLLQMIYDEALQTTRADGGTVLLFDLNRPSPGGPRLRFFIGDEPAAELSDPEKQALEKGETVLWQEPVPEAGPDALHSTLIVPIAYRGKQAGLVRLYSHQPGRFDPTAVEIAQSLAVQAAVVLGNVVQVEQQAQQDAVLNRELETQSRLLEIAHSVQPGQTPEAALQSLVRAVPAVTPFQTVLISLVDPEDGSLRRVCAEGIPDEAWQQLQARRQPWQAIQTLLRDEYKIGAAYFIPADRRPAFPAEVHTVTVLPDVERQEADAWNARDMLLVPVYDHEGAPLGLISVDAPRDGRRPDWQAFKALDLFALQAAAIIETSHKIAGLEAESLTLRMEAEKSREILPSLAQKDQQQAEDIVSLRRQVERLRNSLEVAEQANRQPDLRSVLHTAAQELMDRFGMSAALVAERTPTGSHLLEVIGAVPPGANPEVLFGQRNPLRQVLQDEQLILVSDIEGESSWQVCALLNTLGARSFLTIPLAVDAHHTAGILVISTQPLPPFMEEDRQAFGQVTRQVSVSLQNLELLGQARRRLHELDVLVDFSRKLGSLDAVDILHNLVENVLQILSAAQAGWAGLWDEKERRLSPQTAAGYVDNDSMTGMRLGSGNTPAPSQDGLVSLPVRVFHGGQPLRIQEVQFARDYNLQADDLLLYRRATGGRLPVSDMIIPIRSGAFILGVLVLENFSSPAVFSEEDQNLAFSLAQQAALALDNARLLQSAEQRAAQLQALTGVSGTITSSLRSEDLIASLLDHLHAVLPYDTASLWLRQETSLSVAAARGFEANSQVVGVTVSVEDSQLFGEMVLTGRPIYVPDVREDVRFPSMAEPERISWLGIPLLAKSELVGVIAIDKVEGGFYTEEHIQAATTFSAQAAVALENARLFEESERRAVELDQRSQRLALLNRLSGELSASLDDGYILKMTAQELIRALGISRVAAVTLEDGRCRIDAEVPVGMDDLPVQLPDLPLFAHLAESRGIFNSSEAGQEAALKPLYDLYLSQYHIQSVLIVPLQTGASLHGWLMMLSEQRYRFSLSEIELARTISNQASVSIQNARLFVETRRLTENLERRVQERTKEVIREHHSSQTLLRITNELSGSLDMNLVLNRTLAVLNESVGSEQALIVMAQNSGLKYHAGMDLVGLKSDPSRSSARLESEISRWVIRRRVPALVEDAWIDPRWTVKEDTLRYRSVMAVPMILGEDVLGVLLLLHRKPAVFVMEQVRMVEAAARQISISISNADLFNLIRDQAENLGGMLREQQVEASRSRAILEAVADGVLVTDAANQINLFNASAERILDLKAGQVMGKSLEQFSGLFGKAASAWMQTIRQWSEGGLALNEGQVYAERLELDNSRVVEVHLAPVILGQELLGTVSIFRDITHEVKIDRLKSEFVANVSHELRTPMTSIKGYVDIMLMGAAGDLDPRQVHFLQIVKSNTERLSILVNDLLDVSKIDSGRVSLSMVPLNLRVIAGDVVADLTRRSREENKPMTFDLDIPEDLPLVKGDIERVRQVLNNLVSNGYNYTPEDGCVMVRMRAVGSEVQIDVQDNGIGIGPENQARIFERFYRGEDVLVLATAGTGLGLAITRSLVEMHHGRIWFASSGVRGEGSTFSITLPVYGELEEKDEPVG